MAESAQTTNRNIVDPNENEIVVATPHVAAVLGALDVRGVTVVAQEESKDLGLTLLTLPDNEIRHAVRDDSQAAENPLSQLMRLLYEGFREQYGGWVPTMGRNRWVHPVTGAHTIEGGGSGAPLDAAGQFPARAGDPGRGVRVGIADTALYAHPWLVGGYEAAPASMFEAQKSAPEYSVGHATFVAGLILKQAPGVTLEARRVLNEDATANSWEVAKELVRFGRSGLDVLNLSFGTVTDDCRPPLVLSTALERISSDVVVVAAAGNHGATKYGKYPMWPAAMERVIAVGATDDAGDSPPWSPDPILPWVDVLAPGDGVTSTYLTGEVALAQPPGAPVGVYGGYAAWSGTSFSAARVSGAVAAGVVPGEIGAVTALQQLLEHAARAPKSSKPWIR